MAGAALQAATESGVYVEFRASEAADAPVVERWKLYGASHALVIGIDNYTNGWPRLSNAVKDATLVAEGLQNQGFEVELLTDVTGAQLREKLRRFFAIKGADRQARLFLWFAGHGHTENGEGYLVPADAPVPGAPEFRLTALHMGDVGSMVRIAESKHVLAVFDSCFAGTIFSSQRAWPPAAITAAVKRPVRQFLTSCDAGQKVTDDGSFRTLFLRALQGKETADANRDGYLTGTELSFYLEDRVINLTQGLQTPRGGKLRDPKFDKGDFVFLLPNAPGAPRAETPFAETVAAAAPTRTFNDPSQAALDLEFWNAIKDGDDPADYQAYLEAFPQGSFAPLARRRAEAEARRWSEAMARRQAEAEARRKAEAEARRQAEAETRRQSVTMARHRPKLAEAARRQPEAMAPRQFATTAQRQFATTAQRQAEAEAWRQAEAEARRRAEAMAPRQAEAEACCPAEAEEQSQVLQESPTDSGFVLPRFPWPPPEPSSRLRLPREPFLDASDLDAAASLLVEPLRKAGYWEYSFHRVPNGFALVTRLERINEDGSQAPEGLRYRLPNDEEPFSLSSYFERLFFAPQGYYRLIVFVVTDRPFTATGDPIEEGEALRLLREGINTLPVEYGLMEFSERYGVDALIYEFRKGSGEKQVAILKPGRLGPRVHLDKAGLAAAFGLRRN